MKLKSETLKSGTFYGIKFDQNGVCEVSSEVGEAMLASGLLKPAEASVSTDTANQPQVKKTSRSKKVAQQ